MCTPSVLVTAVLTLCICYSRLSTLSIVVSNCIDGGKTEYHETGSQLLQPEFSLDKQHEAMS